MKKLAACSMATLLLAVPGAGIAQAVCDQLTIGTTSGPNPFPNTVSVTTPFIGELRIQVYTTRPVGDTGAGLTHKCEIAHDLRVVDLMMENAGFADYPANTSRPIFTNAAVKQVADDEVEIVRNVVRALYYPGGGTEKVIEDLKNPNYDLFNPKALNVYYVHSDPNAVPASEDDLSWLTGVHLRDKDGKSAKMIFVGEEAKSDTVAHEFAHAFSAGHVNFWNFDGKEYCMKFLPPGGSGVLTPPMDMKCEFYDDNYMWAGSKADRQTLVEAQRERMKRNEHSIIFEYSPATDKLDCPDVNSEPPCPRMGTP